FINSFYLKLSIALTLLTFQTLEEAYTRTKAFELAYKYCSLYSVPYPQLINHFSQPFLSNTLTTLIEERNNFQTIKAINKLTHFINEIVNQTLNHIQLLQPQPITSNSDNNRFLYKCLRSRSRVQIKESKSNSNLGIIEEEEVPPIVACKVLYSISNKNANITAKQLLIIKPVIAHEANQFSDTNVLKGNNYHGHHPSNKDIESNRVSREEESDNYYFEEYNSASRNLLNRSVVEERTEKKKPCRIDAKMSNETVIGEEIGNFEDKKIDSRNCEKRI
ncbi:22090_t:CDS:2, partial [Gigaspora margarita]